MKQQYAHLKTAIESFGARFALVNPAASPIPVEAPLDLVIAELHKKLKDGFPIHPPREVIKGSNEFCGYELLMSQPMQPGMPVVPVLVVSIFTDMTQRTAVTDQRVIAHGITGLVLAEWIEGIEAEEKKKVEEAAAAAEKAKPAGAADDKVTPFPGSEAAAPKA